MKRTAHVIPAGTFLPMTKGGRSRPVPKGHVGVWCELCEWAVLLPVRFGPEHPERLRRQHLLYVHGDALGQGRACVDPELRGTG